MPLLGHQPPGFVGNSPAYLEDSRDSEERGFCLCLHFPSSHVNALCPLQTCCASGLRRGRQISRSHARTCSVFHSYSRSVGGILGLSVPFLRREFSFPSHPPDLPGRSLPGDGLLLRCFLVTLTSGAPLSFQPISRHASRKKELLDHPLSSTIQPCCWAQ